MPGRILVVDDLPANVKLLEAKLTAEYFDVLTAHDGVEALDRLREEMPDIVLLDVMMPGMDGFEVCRRMKADPMTTHIPVVMLTALNDVADRVRGLEAGADDFLTKPVNDLALFARVKSLLRLKMMIDEWRLREDTCRDFGLVSDTALLADDNAREAFVLVADPSAISSAKIADTLAVDADDVIALKSASETLHFARGREIDLVIVSLALDDHSGLRLCSALRAQDETRQVPILLIIDEEDMPQLVRGLDLGVNDYLIKPIDRNELLARTRTQIRRRRFQHRLRMNYERSLSLALTDALTGLYNRRYLTAHLDGVLNRMQANSKPVSVIMLDIDHFKSINDTHGHDGGDDVLRAVAQRIAGNIRSIDMAARYGGEEFVVLMPDTPLEVAAMVADRLLHKIADEPVALGGPEERVMAVTASIGIAEAGRAGSAAQLIKQADGAMYQAKRQGRNQVVIAPKPEATEASRAANG